MEGLLKLQGCKPEAFRRLPAAIEGVTSPLTEKIAMWEKFLDTHPDQRFKTFLLSGLAEGFQIGFDHKHWGRLKSAKHNMLSCMDHPEVVEGYLAKECLLSRTTGPFRPDEIGLVQISPFGVIPKKGKDSWRLIVDLSSPHGHSVNDSIESESCSLNYITVDMIGDRISELGRGTRMAKLDIKSAFRIIPVHPVDRCLLGMQWRQMIYIDRVGLRSAPRLFSALADGLQFIARSQGIENVAHYLDDFIILGSPGSNQCDQDFQLLVRLCEQLGVPLAEEKKEGPACRLEILGIMFDTELMQMALPERKLAEIKAMLEKWRGRKAATVTEIQSLAGHLQHAAKVVRPADVLSDKFMS